MRNPLEAVWSALYGLFLFIDGALDVDIDEEDAT